MINEIASLLGVSISDYPVLVYAVTCVVLSLSISISFRIVSDVLNWVGGYR